MICEITRERQHSCEALEKCDFVYIQTLNNQEGWFWHFIENKNTIRERTICNRISACPYCGEYLTSPKPLTLEDLEKRRGKPVWIEHLVETSQNGLWCVVNEVVDLIDVPGAEDHLDFDDLGSDYNAYDREPKEES